ncbi:MAG: T9SS C-terminal target domain-containing protein [Candidatus Zixiibacteriota bacterium]|nr:MAG: T9SS C-terminal target domain-containing protein [candidate division Zixibacteria bacterium]
MRAKVLSIVWCGLSLVFLPTVAGAEPAASLYRPIMLHPLGLGPAATAPPAVAPPARGAVDHFDLIGDTMTAGKTWYEIQHNGTLGRMTALDQNVYQQFCWTKWFGPSGPHQIYYNRINPIYGNFAYGSTGIPIEDAQAGYSGMEVAANTRILIAFHWFSSQLSTLNTMVLPGFEMPVQYNEPPLVGGNGLIWPRLQVDRRDRLHLLAVKNVPNSPLGNPLQQYYISAQYDSLTEMITYAPGWIPVQSTMTLAADLSASPVSDRVAYGWTRCRDAGFPTPGGSYSQWNNDIWILIDEDGEDPNFNQAFNLTNFIPPNLSLLPDTVQANKDTLRAYTDMSLFFDNQDRLHVAFTTISYFEIQGTSYWHPSIIWHWTEEHPGEFQTVHNAFDDFWYNTVDCGDWNVKAQRPCLAQDTTTGYLYCAYQVYDTDYMRLSHDDWPSSDVYLSVSTDGGMNWAVGSNVTNTATANNAPAGQCWSEVSLSMAEMADGLCRLQYVVDKDAGNAAFNEGDWTENPVLSHHVPVNQVNTAPLLPQWPYNPDGIPFHIEGGSRVLPDPGCGLPAAFMLHGVFPNPFNSSTVARYEIRVANRVTLRVYDTAGRQVATLVDGWKDAGLHELTFDGAGWPSGIYLLRLEAGEFTAVRKMVLLR